MSAQRRMVPSDTPSSRAACDVERPRRLTKVGASIWGVSEGMLAISAVLEAEYQRLSGIAQGSGKKAAVWLHLEGFSGVLQRLAGGPTLQPARIYDAAVACEL